MPGAIGGRGIAPAGAITAFFFFVVMVVIVTAGTRLAVIVAAAAVVLMRTGGLRLGIVVMMIAVGHSDYSLSA